MDPAARPLAADRAVARPWRRAFAVLALAFPALTVWAQEGLRPPADFPWPKFQTRVESVGAPASPAPDLSVPRLAAPAGARVFGDYLVYGVQSDDGAYAGALRATGGLVLGPRGAAAAGPAGNGLAWRGGTAAPAGSAYASQGYLGVGVSALALRSGWGFSADVGLLSHGAGPGLRLGRYGADFIAADEVLRELRLTPVIQLGVSYAF
jgi:hypothetical protein